MNNICIEKQNPVFEKTDLGMRSHLKPLFIKEKVGNYGVNNVLVDSGATINLISYSLLKKIGNFNTDLRPHDMVLSNYEGKTSHSFGAI